MVVYVATLIPATNVNFNNRISLLNAQIPTMVANKTTVASPVILVDQNTGFDPATDTYDGIHPNATAQPVMLDNVWEVLEPALGH